MKATTPIYSPHVLVLEGIFALYDPRILELLDMKIFAEADADLCLARRSGSKSSGPLRYGCLLTLNESKSREMSEKGGGI